MSNQVAVGYLDELLMIGFPVIKRFRNDLSVRHKYKPLVVLDPRRYDIYVVR